MVDRSEEGALPDPEELENEMQKLQAELEESKQRFFFYPFRDKFKSQVSDLNCHENYKQQFG